MKLFFRIIPLFSFIIVCVYFISCEQNAHYDNEWFSLDCSSEYKSMATNNRELLKLISDSVNIRITTYDYTPRRLIVYDSINVSKDIVESSSTGRVTIYDKKGVGRSVTAGVAKHMVKSGLFTYEKPRVIRTAIYPIYNIKTGKAVYSRDDLLATGMYSNKPVENSIWNDEIFPWFKSVIPRKQADSIVFCNKSKICIGNGERACLEIGLNMCAPDAKINEHTYLFFSRGKVLAFTIISNGFYSHEKAITHKALLENFFIK